MVPHLRLTAALTTGALAASLALPAVEPALATTSVPPLPNISGALTGGGISSANASSIIAELGSLQAVAPAGTLTPSALSALDNSLTTLNTGGLLSIVTLVTNLLTVANAADPTNLESTLSGLSQIGSAPAATSPVKQAAAELSAALETAGLGQLLTQVTGLSSTGDTQALAALATLPGLPLGGSIPAGSLAPVATALSDLAGQVSATAPSASTSLQGAASILSGSGTISPSQLLTAIGDVQSAASGLSGSSASLSAVAKALADQLASSGSIFGGLAGIGSMVPTGDITTALGELAALPSLAAGASVPSGSLATVGRILNGIGSQPGVPAAATATLAAVASDLSSGTISPSLLSTLGGALNTASSTLPAPLASTVSGVAGGLLSSGTLAGLTGTGGTGSGTGGTGSGTGGTGSGTGGTGSGTGATGTTSGSGSLTAAQIAYLKYLIATILELKKQLATAGHSGYGVVSKVSRHGRSLTVLLRCTASAGRRCSTTVTARRSGHSVHRHVNLTGGHSRRLKLVLPVGHGRVTVTARTGVVSTSKSIR